MNQLRAPHVRVQLAVVGKIRGLVEHIGERKQIDRHFIPLAHREIELYVAQAARSAVVLGPRAVYFLRQTVDTHIEAYVETHAEGIHARAVGGGVERVHVALARQPDAYTAQRHVAHVEIGLHDARPENRIRRHHPCLRMDTAKGGGTQAYPYPYGGKKNASYPKKHSSPKFRSALLKRGYGTQISHNSRTFQNKKHCLPSPRF